MSMRILVCLTSVGVPISGAVAERLRVWEVLGNLGHRVEFLTLDAPGAPSLVQGSAVHGIGGRLSRAFGYSGAMAGWLRRNASHYDLVVSSMDWRQATWVLWRRHRRTKQAYVLTTNGRFSPDTLRTEAVRHWLRRIYWLWTGYRAMRDAAGVIFSSEQERRHVRTAFWFYRATEFVVPECGPAIKGGSQSVEDVQRRFPCLSRGRYVVAPCPTEVGDITRLVLAGGRWATSQPDVGERARLLVVVGQEGSPQHAQFESIRAQLAVGRECIQWVSATEPDWRRAVIASADVLLDARSGPSVDGADIKLALSLGRPVLLTHALDLWREVEHDRAGLVDAPTLDGVTHLLERWVALSAESRGLITTAARDSFARRFEVGAVAQTMAAVLGACSRNEATVGMASREHFFGGVGENGHAGTP